MQRTGSAKLHKIVMNCLFSLYLEWFSFVKNYRFMSFLETVVQVHRYLFHFLFFSCSVRQKNFKTKYIPIFLHSQSQRR